MSIDEVIAHAREVAKEQRKACDLAWVWDNPDNIKKCAEEHDQLAEWLEELKSYREIGIVEECKNSVLDIIRAYNKAIDDYNKEIKEYLRKFTVHYVSDNDFDYIAEQLKAGKNNENYNKEES